MENQEQFEARLAELEEQERRAQKRALWFTAIPITIGVIWLLVSYIGVRQFEAKKRDLEKQIQAATETAFPDPIPSAPVSSLNKEAILKGIGGTRHKALESAWSFYEQHPQFPFKWGGKKPEDGGFDTSGYVAYFLAQAGIINQPERYHSGLLKAKFGDPNVSNVGELRAGDLVFEENKACWFVLDATHLLGMVPQGFVIADPSTLGSKASFGRLPYP